MKMYDNTDKIKLDKINSKFGQSFNTYFQLCPFLFFNFRSLEFSRGRKHTILFCCFLLNGRPLTLPPSLSLSLVLPPQIITLLIFPSDLQLLLGNLYSLLPCILLSLYTLFNIMLPMLPIHFSFQCLSWRS